MTIPECPAVSDSETRSAARVEAGRHGRRFVLFSGVGIANTATDLAVFAGFLGLGVPAAAANMAGFLAANGQSYFLNSRVTFRDDGKPARLSPAGYVRFAAAHIVSLFISTAMILAFAGEIGPLWAKASAIAFTALWNYMMSAFLVFRPSEKPL